MPAASRTPSLRSRRPTPDESPRVAILLESSTEWGRQALLGISDFVRLHAHWSIFIEPRGWYERLVLPSGWRGDGVIARITDPGVFDRIDAIGVPAVNLSYLSGPNRAGSRIIQVTTDEGLLGRAAVEYFLSRGFQRFAYVGPTHYPHYRDQCLPAFVEALGRDPSHCKVFRQPKASRLHRDWRSQRERLERWLKTLDHPTAIFAWNSERGRQVIDACIALGLRIPEQVAVLSGENDQVMCELARVPMSGIEHNARRIGYAAAARLALMMAASKTEGRPRTLFAPSGVVTRQSTDIHAIEAPIVARALVYIGHHADEPIQVGDVAHDASLSRRALELRFERSLGYSPAHEIRRVRLDRAKRLLAETPMTIARVAEQAGFTHPEVMTRLFNRHLGKTPSAYRAELRH